MKKILALIAAAVMMLTAAGCSGETAETPDVKSEGVMTYAEYAAAELETPVVVETYVQAKQGWWNDQATLYTQDKEGGYFLYNMPMSEEEYNKLTPGTKIKVSGHKTAWAGEVEIIDATYEIQDGSYVAAAMDATALLGTEELINHQNKFVAFNGLTVEASTDANGNKVVDDNHVHNAGEDHMVLVVFDQLYGGGDNTGHVGIYGWPTHEGVTVIYNNPSKQ
jgi:hypothetical protein